MEIDQLRNTEDWITAKWLKPSPPPSNFHTLEFCHIDRAKHTEKLAKCDMISSYYTSKYTYITWVPVTTK